jgi:hypothetical protein
MTFLMFDPGHPAAGWTLERLLTGLTVGLVVIVRDNYMGEHQCPLFARVTIDDCCDGEP